MLKTKTVTINGVDLTVEYDLESLKEYLAVSDNEFEDGYTYTKMYSVNEGDVTEEEYMNDIAKGEQLLHSLSEDCPVEERFDLEKAVSEIRKKKNGKFWSKSGVDILILENVSIYFTEFTNAWSVLVFRLQVKNETTCELILRERTYTL